MSDNVIDIARTVMVAGFALPAACIHPTIAAAETRTMSAHELLYFTDTPVAHVAAYRDFERELRRERRNMDAFNAYQANARLRAHEARG